MTPYRQMFVFVEGNDDERFFRNVVFPIFTQWYDLIRFIKYAELKKEKVSSFIQSIQSIGASYLFIADINHAPCVTFRKNELIQIYKKLDSTKIVVVIREIEGWYLAGIDEKELKIKQIKNTDHLGKEQFDQLIPSRFASRTDFMMEILKSFSIEHAIQRNQSFRYFATRFGLFSPPEN